MLSIYLDVVYRILFAVFTGCIIGWERKIRGKPVGIITNTLVCVGATILAIYQQLSFTGIEVYGFAMDIKPTIMDTGRLVPQIVSGIGFLGAGTIMRDRKTDSISGITTAATLWIMACLGIIIGAGYWFLSIISVATIIFILFFIKQWTNIVIDHKKLVTIYISCKNNVNIDEIFGRYGLKLSQRKIVKVNNEGEEVIKTIKVKILIPDYINLDKMLGEISSNTDIYKCEKAY